MKGRIDPVNLTPPSLPTPRTPLLISVGDGRDTGGRTAVSGRIFRFASFTARPRVGGRRAVGRRRRASWIVVVLVVADPAVCRYGELWGAAVSPTSGLRGGAVTVDRDSEIGTMVHFEHRRIIS